MGEESPKPRELPAQVRDEIRNLTSEFSGLQEFSSQVFSARQGFYEKLILLNGATLTLLFTVIGGVSHSAITMDALNSVANLLFVGCWLFILSIMLSLLHNHLNIATLIHMSSSVKWASVQGSRALLRMSMMSAGIASSMEAIPIPDPEAQKALKRGAITENICKWVGTAAQASTILGYIALVFLLRAVIRAIAAGAH